MRHLSGRPSTTRPLDNIRRVRLKVEEDRRLNIREIESDVGVPNITV